VRIAVVHNRDQAGVISVFGPQNRERYNPKTVERVAAALEKGGHTVRVIDGNMRVIDELRDFMPRVMSGERPGMVFNMAYGIQGVSRYTHLPAMLEMLGVPYVGSNPLAHGLALDKVIAKIVFQNAGLPTARFWNFGSPDDQFDDLRFPVIVKPKMEAVSYGIQVVHNEKDLREAVALLINEFKQHVLVEEFIPGREFAIGLLGNNDPEVFPIVEIDFEGDPEAIQTADEKLTAPRGKICPAPLTPKQHENLVNLAKRAFRSLDLFDFARVDVRMDKKGRPYILEINSMASLGLTGTYVYGAQTAGYTYESLINRIVDVAAVRYFGQEGVGALETPAARPTKKKRTTVSARIRSYLRSQAGTIEDSLRRMVSMRTPAAEPERVNALGEWIMHQMTQMGFTAQTYPGVNVGVVQYYKNHDDDTNDVLLIGHLDTAGDEYEPYREEGTRLYGTGVAESKGGLAVALAALRALRYARAIRKAKIGVLLTTDETINGARSRPVVEEVAPQSKAIIGLKPGEPEGGVVVSRSGRATYRLQIEYPRRARRPASPARAITHLTERALALQRLSDERSGLRVAITRLEVDAQFGHLPRKAEAAISVRFEQRKNAKVIDARIHEVANERTKEGVRLHVTGRVRRPPMEPTKLNQQLYEDVARIADKLSLSIEPTHRVSSSDICFAPANIPRIDGLGPLGGNTRTDDEYILRHSLVDRAALLALVIRYLATGTEP
jgi:D-alanine-D-alanine ligase